MINYQLFSCSINIVVVCENTIGSKIFRTKNQKTILKNNLKKVSVQVKKVPTETTFLTLKFCEFEDENGSQTVIQRTLIYSGQWGSDQRVLGWINLDKLLR
ncbi:Hypothetical_protein [Hexamita inflata]|uniref:Hypothetical_protein n=1 Tax=Hexamita inflata TaxID=28002 RepID=A0AA86QWA5_9EUKA|nr:Hypothetical protein HINF_LOCUS48548 [Hexamita inflata]